MRKLLALALALLLCLSMTACVDGGYWMASGHEFTQEEFEDLFGDIMMLPTYIPEDLRDDGNVVVSGDAHIARGHGERQNPSKLDYTKKEDIKYYDFCSLGYQIPSEKIGEISAKENKVVSFGISRGLRDQQPIDLDVYPNTQKTNRGDFYWKDESRDMMGSSWNHEEQKTDITMLYAGHLIGVRIEINEVIYEVGIQFVYDKTAYTKAEFEELRDSYLTELVKVIESLKYTNEGD